MDAQEVEKDDAQLLHDAVENIGSLSDSIDRLAAQVAGLTFPEPAEPDDRIARALESIANTLERLERQ